LSELVYNVVGWLQKNWFIITMVSLVIFMGSIATIPYLLTRIPANYFRLKNAGKQSFQSPIFHILFHIAKNAFGLICLVSGIVMLVMPGQGILTIFIGIMLLDIPGKRRVERYFISRPNILSTVNKIRQKRNTPPLDL